MKNVSHAICKDIRQIAVPPLPSSYTCQLLNSCIETDFTGEPPTATVKFAAALPKEFISVVSRSAPNAGTEHLLKFDRVKNISQKWTFLPGTWALIFMYTASNAGHVLGDEVWPAWRMLATWGLEYDASNLNVVTDILTPSLNQYAALTRRAVIDGKTLRAKYGDVVCFDLLLVGPSYLGYALGLEHHKSPDPLRAWPVTQDPTFAKTFLKFRTHALDLLNIPATWSEVSPLILVLEKGSIHAHSHIISNIPEILSRVQNSFPTAKVLGVNWQGMPMKSQVEMMSAANVVLSLPGSDIMNSVWLNVNSVLIIVCRDESGQCTGFVCGIA
jgi:hypothetical protein